jgi:hypothetical protein
MTMRKHLVLVPGFVGFDALGQLRYYVGVTRLLGERAPAGTVHYFDNFPTASVANRAIRLRTFLAKKIARGEIREGDELTLLGHSTGGLDIRKLMQQLSDGGKTLVDDRVPVSHAVIKGSIKRLVFMSVPHYGTNIADYASDFQVLIKDVLHKVAIALRDDQPPVTTLRAILSKGQRHECELLYALRDALVESDVRGSGGPLQLANEREARSQLVLWLEHMSSDFEAILDLRSGPQQRKAQGVQGQSSGAAADQLPGVGETSPAHFSFGDRSKELEGWGTDITTLSFATVVPRHVLPARDILATLARFLRRAGEPLTHIFEFLSRLGITKAIDQLGVDELVGAIGSPALVAYLNDDPAALFRYVYAVCADPSGPFHAPSGDPTYHKDFVELDGSPARSIQDSDNDGIVNTRSMFWPFDPKRPHAHEGVIVSSDHADIMGHCGLMPKQKDVLSDRSYDAYDLFQSGAGFDKFDAVWRRVFDFAFPDERKSKPPAREP